jgi:hypothetical protein
LIPVRFWAGLLDNGLPLKSYFQGFLFAIHILEKTSRTTNIFYILDTNNMMPNNHNVDALTVIINVLKDLDIESQKRTIKAVTMFLGISLDYEVNKNISIVEDKIKAVDTSFTANRQISPKDFLRDKMPTTDVEKIACLAYYLTHYRNTPHFKTLDLSSLNVEAAQPKFSNAAYAVDNSVRAGFLVQALKGAKQLSSVGEIFVQNLPDKEAARLAVANLRVKKRAKKTLKK